MDVELASREKYVLDLSSQYSVFTKPGDYALTFQYEEKEYVESLEVKYRGTI
jgi:hypothetical protein